MRPWLVLVAVTVFAAQAPAAPEPPANAALRYWVAFDRLPQLTDAQQKALDATPPALDATAEAMVKSAENSFHYLHRGAAIAFCDWGPEVQDGPYMLMPYLARARQLGRLAVLDARLHFAAGHTAAGLDELFDTFTLARHCGPGPMIAMLVQNAIEFAAIDALAAQLPKLDAATLAGLNARLDKLPAPTRVRDTLAHETRWFVTWLKDKVGDGHGDAWRQEFLGFITNEDPSAPKLREGIKTMSGADMVKALDRLAAAYDEMGSLLKLSPEQFAARWPAFKAQAQKASVVAECTLPALDTVIDRDHRIEVKRALLRAAIAVAKDGPAALKNHPDPFGKGPFEYKALPQGFELKSKFLQNGTPMTLTAGPAAK